MPGIKLEGPVAKHHAVSLVEFFESCSELSDPEITEGTDHVAPDVDQKSFTHLVIVPQQTVLNRSTIWRPSPAERVGADPSASKPGFLRYDDHGGELATADSYHGCYDFAH